MSEKLIGVMKGDFIGPEIMGASLPIIEKAAELGGIEVEFVPIPASAEAYDLCGEHLPESSIETAKQMDAILKGPFGGPPNSTDPKWSGLEQKSILALRKELGLYANLRPVKTLGDTGLELSPLKEEYAEGRDLMIVRELDGGIYYGKQGSGIDADGKRYAFETNYYTEDQVSRIVEAAIKVAVERDDKLTLVHKTNVLKETGGLWTDIFDKLTAKAGVETDYLHVDNASAAILTKLKNGTIVIPNMEGDILSDENAGLGGSLGLGGSASLGDNVELYEPIHGSAADLKDIRQANPIGMIMSAALMFKHSFGLPQQAEMIEEAVIEVLDSGFITYDLQEVSDAHWGTSLDAREFGEHVLDMIEAISD